MTANRTDPKGKPRSDGKAKRGPTADRLALNPQQRRFVTIYHAQVDKNQAQAAIEAGYSANGATVTGCRLLKHPSVKAALEKLETAEAKASLITKASVMADLTRLGEGAEAAGQFAAAIKAIELQGKTLRLFDDPKAISIGEAVALIERVVSRLVPLIADDRRDEAQAVVQDVLGSTERAA